MAWLGLLMLDTRFPRPPGDVGHPDTFAFEVRRQGVPGATPLRAVRGDTAALVRPFADAARSLVEQGAAAISTSCGFLVLLQRELQATVPVPVWTSALLALPGLPRPGVVTADAASLGAAHLLAAGADAATPVAGLAPGCHLHRTLLHDQPTLLVTGSNGKTTTTRLLVAMATQAGLVAGSCSTEGVVVDEDQLEDGYRLTLRWTARQEGRFRDL